MPNQSKKTLIEAAQIHLQLSAGKGEGGLVQRHEPMVFSFYRKNRSKEICHTSKKNL